MLHAKISFLLINWTWDDQSNLLSINTPKYFTHVVPCNNTLLIWTLLLRNLSKRVYIGRVSAAGPKVAPNISTTNDNLSLVSGYILLQTIEIFCENFQTTRKICWLKNRIKPSWAYSNLKALSELLYRKCSKFGSANRFQRLLNKICSSVYWFRKKHA